MNTRVPFDKASVIIGELTDLLDQIAKVLDQVRIYFENDYSYFENFNKHCNNIASAMDVCNHADFKSSSLGKQEAGYVFHVIFDEFNKFSGLITCNIFENLKKHISLIQKEKGDFENVSKNLLQELNNAFVSFRSQLAAEFTKVSQLEDPNDYVKYAFQTAVNPSQLSEPLTSNPRSVSCPSISFSMHAMYSRTYASIRVFEQRLLKELDRLETFINKMLQEEDTILQFLTPKLNDNLLIDLKGFTTQVRQLPQHQHMSYFKDLLIMKIFDLKSFSGPPSLPQSQMTHLQWTRTNDQTFYARVWEDYTPKSQWELTLVKREIVFVFKVTPHYWYCRRANKQEGYAPVTILEPLNDVEETRKLTIVMKT